MLSCACLGRATRLGPPLRMPTTSSSSLSRLCIRCSSSSAAAAVAGSAGPAGLPRRPQPVTILGIESSCDDSCAAVVRGIPWPDPVDPSLPLCPPPTHGAGAGAGTGGAETGAGAGPWKAEVLANVVLKQDHYVTRGVHPLVASKAHATNVPRAVRAALAEAAQKTLSQQRTVSATGTCSPRATVGQSGGVLDGPSDPLGPEMIDAIAVTQGPGMAASLASGLVTAKTLSAVWGKPLIYVHHMAGHALVPLLVPRDEDIRTPFLAVLVSGGHSLLVLVRGPEKYEVVASTMDEAMGRVFDKAAVILGLVWGPAAGTGGPTNAGASVERAAQQALPEDVERLRAWGFRLPAGLSGSQWGYDMAFGGIKLSLEQQVRKLVRIPRSQSNPQDVPLPGHERTAAWAASAPTKRRSAAAAPAAAASPCERQDDSSSHGGVTVEADPEFTVANLELDEGPVADLDVGTVRALAYLLQEAVVGQLVRRVVEWLGGFRKRHGKVDAAAPGASVQDVVLAGGVAANAYLRETLAVALARGGRADVTVHTAPPAWCTDNAAMIAHAGLATYARRTHDLSALAVPSWPLDMVRAPPAQPLARVRARSRNVRIRTSRGADAMPTASSTTSPGSTPTTTPTASPSNTPDTSRPAPAVASDA